MTRWCRCCLNAVIAARESTAGNFLDASRKLSFPPLVNGVVTVCESASIDVLMVLAL
jgi:hypothetical protein